MIQNHDNKLSNCYDESFSIDDENDLVLGHVFPKLSNSLSIKEKIELTVELHENNYFLDTPIHALGNVDKRIRPLKIVTKQHLHNMRSTKGLNNKLSWVLRNRDKDFARSFINDLVNDNFTSVKQAQHAARDIFKEYNSSEYKFKQATYSTRSSVRNEMLSKSEESNQSAEPDCSYQMRNFIEMAKEKLKRRSTVELIKAHCKKGALQRLATVNTNSPAILFAKDAIGHDKSTATNVLAITTLALFHEILESFDKVE